MHGWYGILTRVSIYFNFWLKLAGQLFALSLEFLSQPPKQYDLSNEKKHGPLWLFRVNVEDEFLASSVGIIS